MNFSRKPQEIVFIVWFLPSLIDLMFFLFQLFFRNTQNLITLSCCHHGKATLFE